VGGRRNDDRGNGGTCNGDSGNYDSCDDGGEYGDS